MYRIKCEFYKKKMIERFCFDIVRMLVNIFPIRMTKNNQANDKHYGPVIINIMY